MKIEVRQQGTHPRGEKITIGESIVISVIEVRGSQVRLGISAAQEVTIHRGEIYERIREQNLQASALGLSHTGALSEKLRAILLKNPSPR